MQRNVTKTVRETQGILPGDAFASNLSVLANVRFNVSTKIGHATIELLVTAAGEWTDKIGFPPLVGIERTPDLLHLVGSRLLIS